MNWCYREPTLTEMLSDTLVRSLMKADGVDAGELRTMLREVADRRSITEPDMRRNPPGEPVLEMDVHIRWIPGSMLRTAPE